jgi:hypothetical protein
MLHVWRGLNRDLSNASAHTSTDGSTNAGAYASDDAV